MNNYDTVLFQLFDLRTVHDLELLTQKIVKNVLK